MLLLPLPDGVAEGEGGREAGVRELGAGERVGCLAHEPALNGRALEGVAVGDDNCERAEADAHEVTRRRV